MNRTLTIGILLLVGVAVGTFLTWPTYQSFQETRLSLQVKEQELQNRETYFADLAKVQADLAGVQDQLAKVEAALPPDPQLPALYNFLQNTTALSGMSLRNISSSVEQQAQTLNLRTLPVTLEVTGSYGALKELVSRLNTASRMAQLQSLNVTGAQDPGRFAITVQLHAYSY